MKSLSNIFLKKNQSIVFYDLSIGHCEIFPYLHLNLAIQILQVVNRYASHKIQEHELVCKRNMYVNSVVEPQLSKGGVIILGVY